MRLKSRRMLFAPVLALVVVLTSAAASLATEPPPIWKRMWGTTGSGPGQFGSMRGISADCFGNIYVGDRENSRVQKFTGSGGYLTEWGQYGSGDGEFSYLYGAAADAYDYLYVADEGNDRVQKFTSSGAYAGQW